MDLDCQHKMCGDAYAEWIDITFKLIQPWRAFEGIRRFALQGHVTRSGKEWRRSRFLFVKRIFDGHVRGSTLSADEGKHGAEQLTPGVCLETNGKSNLSP